MEIRGFKAFNKDMTNRYGIKFEEGKTYSVLGPVKFGNDGNGFHFCSRMEDTLRYFDAMNGEVKIAEVVGSGETVEFYDDYYGYYDMYATSSITIGHVYEREEIITAFLEENEFRVDRFLQGFRLSLEEVEMFKVRFSDNSRIMNTIFYYQEGDLDVYSRVASEMENVRQKVKEKGKRIL